MAEQHGRHSEMITQLLRHVTSSPHDVDVEGDIFTAYYLPSNSRCPCSFYILGVTERAGGGGGGGGGNFLLLFVVNVFARSQ